MEPSLTWFDLTARDSEKMRRVLDLFSEEGTLDEMGLSTLRDTLSDALFPGTSSIQTRLRYVLIIPWLYQRLESRLRHNDNLDRDARKAEIDLIAPLTESDNLEGVIGVRARAWLTRLLSHVYWAGLVRWGVFRLSQSQSWYHTHFASLVQGIDEIGRPDDPGIVWAKQPVWHPRLPEPPNWHMPCSRRRPRRATPFVRCYCPRRPTSSTSPMRKSNTRITTKTSWEPRASRWITMRHVSMLKYQLSRFCSALKRAASGNPDQVVAAKTAVQETLQSVMAWTDRVAASGERKASTKSAV